MCILSDNWQTQDVRCSSDGAPEFDGALRSVDRKKILHYRQLYIDRPEPIAFIPVTVDTSVRIYDDFLRLLFLDSHRESLTLDNEIPEESGQFRFLRISIPCFFSSVFCLSDTSWVLTYTGVVLDVNILIPRTLTPLTVYWTVSQVPSPLCSSMLHHF